MTKPKTNTQAKITPKRIMGNFFFKQKENAETRVVYIF